MSIIIFLATVGILTYLANPKAYKGAKDILKIDKKIKDKNKEDSKQEDH